ncbi:translation initiation factor IF-2-like [Motacilla alba alba]|uniref:translation initiation factor IF-2-like n=1 Tax=Motacilla alba alba TaxID=1094192 RepID=UPI0018D50531|nr:translation initiation factor IF-2-like [Motacilla alba alba]
MRGWRDEPGAARGLQPGHLTGGAPRSPGSSGQRGGCRPYCRGDRREACPGNETRRRPGPERGAGARLRCPTAGNPRGLRRVRALRCAAKRCPGPRGLLPLGSWCRWGSAPCSHPATSAAPSQHAASPVAGGWLPARRLAPPPASGDKGIKRHARSSGRGGGGLGRLQHPVPPERLPRRLRPRPPALPPAGPGSGEAPGAPAVAHCSRNQAGPPPAPAVLGATGFAAAATGKGMPGDTLFSHFKTAKLACRAGAPFPPPLLGARSTPGRSRRRCGGSPRPEVSTTRIRPAPAGPGRNSTLRGHRALPEPCPGMWPVLAPAPAPVQPTPVPAPNRDAAGRFSSSGLGCCQPQDGLQPPHGSRGFSLHGRAGAGWPGAREAKDQLRIAPQL